MLESIFILYNDPSLVWCWLNKTQMKPCSMLNFEQLLTLSWIFNGTALTIKRLIIPQLKKNPYYYILILFECCMYIFDHKDLSHIKHTVDNWIILIVSSLTNGTLQINNFCFFKVEWLDWYYDYCDYWHYHFYYCLACKSVQLIFPSQTVEQMYYSCGACRLQEQ